MEVSIPNLYFSFTVVARDIYVLFVGVTGCIFQTMTFFTFFIRDYAMISNHRLTRPGFVRLGSDSGLSKGHRLLSTHYRAFILTRLGSRHLLLVQIFGTATTKIIKTLVAVEESTRNLNISWTFVASNPIAY